MYLYHNFIVIIALADISVMPHNYLNNKIYSLSKFVVYIFLVYNLSTHGLTYLLVCSLKQHLSYSPPPGPDNHNFMLCVFKFGSFYIPYIRDSVQHLFFFVWLIPLSIMFRRSIHVAVNGKNFFFSCLNGVQVCVAYIHAMSSLFTHLLTDTGCLYILVNAEKIMKMDICPQ